MNNFEQNEAKLGRYVRDGQAHLLAQMIADGKLSHLSEFELRQNMAIALYHSAEIREQLEHEAGFGNPVLQTEAINVDRQMEMMGFAAQRRQKALEISWNPEGMSLLDQIREFIPLSSQSHHTAHSG